LHPYLQAAISHYLTRAYFLTFFGEPHLKDEEWKEVKEAPSIMLGPVSLLALLSIFGGLLGYTFGKTPLLQYFLNEVDITPAEQELRSGYVLTPETWMAVIGAILGIGLFAWLYTKYVNRLGKPVALFQNSFYVNEIYDAIFVKPLKSLANAIAYFIEPKIFNGMVNGATRSIQELSGWLQQLQSGQIRSYLAWIVAGSVLLLVYLAF
jgi:NADH-quinone oxidoreductase subunit L